VVCCAGKPGQPAIRSPSRALRYHPLSRWSSGLQRIDVDGRTGLECRELVAMETCGRRFLPDSGEGEKLRITDDVGRGVRWARSR
jgi:hypothetical protein